MINLMIVDEDSSMDRFSNAFQVPEISIVGVVHTEEAAFQFLENNKVDVAFILFYSEKRGDKFASQLDTKWPEIGYVLNSESSDCSDDDELIYWVKQSYEAKEKDK